MSYVRGGNQNNGDNLYRIAPLRGDVNLGGIIRVSGSDVPVGAHIPGAG